VVPSGAIAHYVKEPGDATFNKIHSQPPEGTCVATSCGPTPAPDADLIKQAEELFEAARKDGKYDGFEV
jgi:hypothetical protein